MLFTSPPGLPHTPIVIFYNWPNSVLVEDKGKRLWQKFTICLKGIFGQFPWTGLFSPILSESQQEDSELRSKVTLTVFAHQHFCLTQEPLGECTLTPKVIALFQSKISIFACVTGIATNMGFTMTVTI